MLTTLFLIISYFAIGFYAILIVELAMTWSKLRTATEKVESDKSISVIIVFRNEEKNLPGIISLLKNQKNSVAGFEIILIDDHSTDHSYDIASSLVDPAGNIRLHRLDDDRRGKKSGIQLGIQHAQYPWIATLDADVEIGAQWLQTLQKTSDADLHILPLIIKPDNTLLGDMQALEFLSLMGITATMCFVKMPILCNGANLLFSKEIYEKTMSTRTDHDIASGDDMFLMHEVKKTGKVRWLHELNALAKTGPETNLRAFTGQRIRWAGKSKHYTDFTTKAIGILVFTVNLVLLTGAIASCFSDAFSTNFLFVLFTKTIVDFILIERVSRWTNMRHLLKYYILVSILYPIYVVAIALASMVIKPGWKGRRID